MTEPFGVLSDNADERLFRSLQFNSEHCLAQLHPALNRKDRYNFKNGFADINGNYWLGNEAIHNYLAEHPYQLYVYFYPVSAVYPHLAIYQCHVSSLSEIRHPIICSLLPNQERMQPAMEWEQYVQSRVFNV